MKKIFTLFLTALAMLALPQDLLATDNVFDFANNPWGLPVTTASSVSKGRAEWHAGELNGKTITVGDVSMNFTSYINNGTMSSARMDNTSTKTGQVLYVPSYGGFRVKAAEGKAIKSVTIVSSSKIALSPNTGTLTANVWTGNATNVIFYANTTNNLYASSITVVTEDKDDETANPSMDYVEAADLGVFKEKDPSLLNKGQNVKLMLTDAEVVAVNDSTREEIYVQDKKGAAIFTLTGLGLKPGDVLNGYVYVRRGATSASATTNLINVLALGTYDTNTDNLTITHTDNLSYVEGALSEVVSQKYVNRLVSVKGVYFKGSSAGTYTCTVYDTENKVSRNTGIRVNGLPKQYNIYVADVKGVVYCEKPSSNRYDLYPTEIIGYDTKEQVFDFKANSLNLPVGSSSDQNAGDLTPEGVTVKDVVLTSVNGNTNTRVWSRSQGISLVLYKDATLTLTGKAAYSTTGAKVAIDSIRFVTQTGNLNLTVHNENGTLDKTAKTWKGNAPYAKFDVTSTTYLDSIIVYTKLQDAETITPATDTYTATKNIDAFNKLETGSFSKVSLKDAQVNAVSSDGKSVYLEDASGATIFYNTGLGLKQGDILNGWVNGKKTVYGSASEFVATDSTTANGYAVTTATLKTAEVTSISSISKADSLSRLFTLNNVTIEKDGTKYYAHLGEDSIQIYDQLKVMPSGFDYTPYSSVTGILVLYSGNYQIAPIDKALFATPESVKYDFKNNNLGMAVSAASGDGLYDGDLWDKVVTNGNVNMTSVTGTAPTRLWDNKTKGKVFTLFTESGLKFEATNGKAISKIEFFDNTASNTALKATAANGTLDRFVWTGNATVVRFSPSATVYLDSIIVTTVDSTALTEVPAALAYMEVADIAAYNGLANGTLAKLKLTDAVVTAISVDANMPTYYVQDATGGSQFAVNFLKFNKGDKLNGYVYATRRSLNTNASQIRPAEDTKASDYEVTAGAEATPKEGTIGEINKNENLNMLVKISGVQIDSVSTAANGSCTATATLNEETITLYNGTTGRTLKALETIHNYKDATVVGILAANSKTVNYLYPISIEGTVVSGIQEISNDASIQNPSIYNLQGARLNKVQRGINIVNGKKIIIQ